MPTDEKTLLEHIRQLEVTLTKERRRLWDFIHKAYIEDAFVCPVCGGTDGDHNGDIIPDGCELDQRSATKTVDRSEMMVLESANKPKVVVRRLSATSALMFIHIVGCTCIDCFHARGSYKDEPPEEHPSLLHPPNCGCELCF